MNIEELKTYWKSEESKAFKGWDFSYLRGRRECEKSPWDYSQIVLSHLKNTDKLLDMGTGGGEFLLTLNHPYTLTAVTEAYPPNLKLCQETLSPLGISVNQVVEDAHLPFRDNSFDIIINRHTSFDIGEVKRILKSSGYFITQQVGEKNNIDLSSRLINNFYKEPSPFDVASTTEALKAFGFEIITTNEVYPKARFYDIGALVYYAKIIKWEFPDFSVDTSFETLIKLQEELNRNGYIEATEHRFIIVARKSAN